MTSMDRLYQLVNTPLISEKGTDDSNERSTYHFRVPLDANKVEIRQAVEKLFNVTVLGVNTLRMGGKARRRGYLAGHTPDWKKAMVKLRAGDTIEIL